MKVVRLSLAVLALASILGCYKTTLTVGSGGNTAGTPKKDEMNMFFIYGLIGSSDTNINSICPGGNATVVVQHTFLDGLISNCSGGLVSPNHVSVYCGEAAAPAPAPSAQLTPAQVDRLVNETNFEEKLVDAVVAQSN